MVTKFVVSGTTRVVVASALLVPWWAPTVGAEIAALPGDRRAAHIEISPDMAAAAKKAAQARPDAAMLERATTIKRRVEEATAKVKSQMAQPNTPTQSPAGTSKALPKSAHKGRLYVFVSASVPTTTLRRYAAVMDNTRIGTMVLNGFVDSASALKPTMAFIHRVITVDEACEGADCKARKVGVDINPILFRKYNIQHVPAFVWEPEPKDAFCDDDLKPVTDAIVVEGDADLFHVLETIEQITHDPELTAITKEHVSL